jgi:uncharacterized protein (DUF697 family)/tellurite resistance protein
MEQPLDAAEQRAIMTLALMAAFADGRNDDGERAELERVAVSLSNDTLNVASLYQDVLLNRATVGAAAAALKTPEARQLAYELCVGVCSADGAQNDAERKFLASLSAALGLDGTAFSERANALAAAPLAVVSPAEPAVHAGSMSADELERLILHYAILNGALELLPDRLATMAIVPLQMKMVYRIGQSYGVSLDASHIKEFIATAGVGMASQIVEQIGVKLVGAFFGGGLVGGLLGSLAGQSVSSGFSFATTYALGKLAVRYYAGGRTFSAQLLKDTYDSLLQEAKGLQGQHLSDIRERARTINLSQVLADVRQ